MTVIFCATLSPGLCTTALPAGARKRASRWLKDAKYEYAKVGLRYSLEGTKIREICVDARIVEDSLELPGARD